VLCEDFSKRSMHRYFNISEGVKVHTCVVHVPGNNSIYIYDHIIYNIIKIEVDCFYFRIDYCIFHVKVATVLYEVVAKNVKL
jgi:hypothetical protein